MPSSLYQSEGNKRVILKPMKTRKNEKPAFRPVSRRQTVLTIKYHNTRVAARAALKGTDNPRKWILVASTLVDIRRATLVDFQLPA
jgi:hypothetical protein